MRSRGTISAMRQVTLLVVSHSASRWSPLGPTVVVAAAALAAIGLTRFDGLYGQDAFAYYGYAVGALRASLQHFQLPPPFFWPPGYPLTIAGLSFIVGSTPIAGQIASVAAGAAVPGVTVLLAQEASLAIRVERGRRDHAWRAVPVVAGLITAVTGQLLQSSIVVMADTVGLAAATTGAWSLLRYARGGVGGWLVLASGMFAFGAISRWIYALVAVPFAIYAVLVLIRRPRRYALMHASSAAVIAGLILTPVVVPLMIGLVTGVAAPFGGEFHVYSWNPLNAVRTDFVTPDGHLRYTMPVGLYYLLTPGQWWYFAPFLGVLIPFGVWAAIGSSSISLRLIVVWAAVVFAFHAGAPYENPRFALAYLPPAAILAAIGFATVWGAVETRFHTAATAYLMVGIVLSAGGSLVLTSRFIERKNDDLATVQWVAKEAPPDTQLVTFGLTATFKRYSGIETLDLADLSPSSMERLVSDGRPTLVLLDVAGVERQWTGRPPWENYRWLRDGPGLIPIGARGPYSLLAIHT